MPGSRTKQKRQVRRATNVLRKVAAAFETARSKRDEARASLARLSRPGDPHHIVDSSAAWMERALARIRPRLLRIPGVVGVGLGHRIQAGRWTPEPCISVFVDRKISLEEMEQEELQRVPELTRVGKRRLRIDVVQLGKLDRQINIGANIGPATRRDLGTFGVVARDMTDNS